MHDLQHEIGVLAGEAVMLFRNLMGAISELAQWARGLIGEALSRIRARAWDATRSALYVALPTDVAAVAEAAVRDVFDAAFDAARWLLDASLSVLQGVADWVHDELMAQIAAGAISEDLVRSSALGQADATSTQDLRVRVSLLGVVDLGEIRLPGSHVVGEVINLLFGGETLDHHIAAAAAPARDLGDNHARQGALTATLADERNRDRALLAAGNMVGLGALRVELNGIQSGLVYEGQATIQITVRGANSSYLAPVLGVPPRVRVLLNGQDIAYGPGSWGRPNRLADTLALAATILASPVGVTVGPPGTGRFVPLTTPTPRATVIVGSAGARRAASLVGPVNWGDLNTRSLLPRLRRSEGGWPGDGGGGDGVDGIDGDGTRIHHLPMLDFPDLPDAPSPITLIGRPGLNSLQVLVVDGSEGGRSADARVSFYLSQPFGLG